MMNKMSNIYVPIDFSNVKNAIPPEQEIIYSTYAQVKFRSPNVYTGSGIRYSKATWKSHLLITPKGLAFDIHHTKGNITCYVPLYLTSFLLKMFFTAVPDILEDGVSLSLVRIPEYEKKDTFKKRSKEFKSFLKPFRLKVLLDWVKEVYSEFENNPDYSYNDYILSHEYPIGEIAFKYLKKFIKEGKTLDEIIERYTKMIQKY